MSKRILALVLLLLLCLVFTPCRPAPLSSGEAISLDGFEVILSQPEVEFPSSIIFNIEVEGDADISKITLQYRVNKSSPIPVTSVAFPQFEPATRVETSWTWDMRETSGLPPGTELSYWWAIEDTEGDRVETPQDKLHIDDSRHSWKSLTTEGVSLYWYRSDNSFAQELMDTAQEALDRLATDTGVQLEEEAKIYVYASSQDLLGALIYPQEWTGGVAFTEYNTIAIGISPDNLAWGKSAIAHELAHLVIHQVISSGYGVGLPTWLDEGLAMYAEGELSTGMENILRQAVDNNSLLSVQSICSPFPTEAEAAYLAYAESYSLVDFLLEEQGGKAEMLELLDAFKQGSGYVEALDRVYGLSIEQLDSLWQKYVETKSMMG